MIKGKMIDLIPAALRDRQMVYEWCFCSETTKSHSGPPDYLNNPIMSYEDFCAHGYVEHYFTGTKPREGRGLLIVNNDEPIGFISYCSFHLKPGIAEFDIWFPREADCGKGYGTDALLTLADYVFNKMDFREIIIAPSARNKRAVRAYEKAGFIKTDKAMSEFLLNEYVSLYGGGDYGADDTAILVKHKQGV